MKMLFVNGYASVHQLEEMGKSVKGCLRVARKLEGQKDENGQDAYEVQFFNAVFLGESLEEIGASIKNKSFIKIEQARLVNETHEGKNYTKLLVFKCELVETGKNDKKVTTKKKFD